MTGQKLGEVLESNDSSSQIQPDVAVQPEQGGHLREFISTKANRLLLGALATIAVITVASDAGKIVGQEVNAFVFHPANLFDSTNREQVAKDQAEINPLWLYEKL